MQGQVKCVSCTSSFFALDQRQPAFEVALAVSLIGLDAAARLGPHRLVCLARKVWHSSCECGSQSSFHSGALSYAHLLTFLRQFKDELHCRPICTSKGFGRSP